MAQLVKGQTVGNQHDRTEMKRLHITHVIGSLDVGGAERVLCSLLAQIDPATTTTSVITLLDGGALKGRLVEQGIDVHSLGMSRHFPQPGVVVQLARHLSRRRPAVVVTWLYHSNLIGGLAARMAGGMPVVWNIRHNTLQAPLAKRSTRWVNWCTRPAVALDSVANGVCGTGGPAEPRPSRLRYPALARDPQWLRRLDFSPRSGRPRRCSTGAGHCERRPFGRTFRPVPRRQGPRKFRLCRRIDPSPPAPRPFLALRHRGHQLQSQPGRLAAASADCRAMPFTRPAQRHAASDSQPRRSSLVVIDRSAAKRRWRGDG